MNLSQGFSARKSFGTTTGKILVYRRSAAAFGCRSYPPEIPEKEKSDYPPRARDNWDRCFEKYIYYCNIRRNKIKKFAFESSVSSESWFHVLGTRTEKPNFWPLVAPSTVASMMAEGCAKGVKYGLFVANGVILVGGIVVFSVGIWTLADRSFMERLLGSDLYVSSAAILIATGIIVSVISFLGFLGAVKEIKCMLLTFFIILFMIFVTMLVGGILGYVFRNEVDDRMYTEMLMTIKLYQNDTAVTDAWDAVQTHFECCGMSMEKTPGYEIWSKRNPNFNGDYKIPATCCRTKDVGLRDRCQKDPTENNAYLEGCYEKMKEFVLKHAKVVGGIGVSIACLLIIGMALSCALFWLIK